MQHEENIASQAYLLRLTFDTLQLPAFEFPGAFVFRELESGEHAGGGRDGDDQPRDEHFNCCPSLRVVGIGVGVAQC